MRILGIVALSLSLSIAATADKLRPTSKFLRRASWRARGITFLMRSALTNRVISMPRLEDRKFTTENYAALGQFVSSFEAMVDQVREICITTVCTGMGSERQRLVEISSYHQAMTAKPLFDIMRAIIAEVVSSPASPQYTKRETFKKVLGCIESEYSHLCYKRNALLHGTWYFGSIMTNTAKTFRVRKYKTTADGLASVESLPKNAAELFELVVRCEDVGSWLRQVDFCVQGAVSIDFFFNQEPGQPWKLLSHAESAGYTLPRNTSNAS
jgi:hypothetical protein